MTQCMLQEISVCCKKESQSSLVFPGLSRSSRNTITCMQSFMRKFPGVIMIWVSRLVSIKPLKGANKTSRHTDTDPPRLLMLPRDRPGPKKIDCATKVIERKSKSKHMEQINHRCLKTHSLQRTVNSHQSYFKQDD